MDSLSVLCGLGGGRFFYDFIESGHMDDLHKEFIEIIADIRAHLEFQHALGIRMMEIEQGEGTASIRDAGYPASAPSAGPNQTAIQPDAADRGTKENIPDALMAVRNEIGDCKRCKLYKGRKNIVFGEGNPNADLVFVGEGPGSEEDEQGRPFVGEAGQLLTKIIESGMKLRRSDVYICNIVKCRPPGNRTPQPDEIDACKQFVMRQIEIISPKVIVTLGNVPTQTLLGTKEGITKIRGRWQTYMGIPLMPTFHPAYLLRNPSDKRLVWEDIQKVMQKLEEVKVR